MYRLLHPVVNIFLQYAKLLKIAEFGEITNL